MSRFDRCAVCGVPRFLHWVGYPFVDSGGGNRRRGTAPDANGAAVGQSPRPTPPGELAEQAKRIAADVRAVDANPMWTGKVGGVASLSTAVELLAEAVLLITHEMQSGEVSS